MTMAPNVVAAARPKVVSFGRWLNVKWTLGTDDNKSVDMKVRALLVNGDPKEFTTGEPHDITDQIFVVRRALRLNDSLPGDELSSPKWRWQPDTWIMVDRRTAHVSKLTLPEFDQFYSSASWYRDFVAYCGISDSGDKLEALVVQVGRKKPILKKFITAPRNGDLPGSECEAPTWERQPMRVTFHPKNADQVIFTVRERSTELLPDNSEPVDSAEPPDITPR